MQRLQSPSLFSSSLTRQTRNPYFVGAAALLRNPKANSFHTNLAAHVDNGAKNNRRQGKWTSSSSISDFDPTNFVELDKRGTLLKAEYGQYRVLALNNPRNFNRLDENLATNLLHQFKLYNNTTMTPVLGFHSTGGHTFCGGADIQSMYKHVERGNHAAAASALKAFNKTVFYASTMEKLMLTVINGQLIGGGASLGCHADYTIATPNASFCVPDVAWSSIPYGGSTFLLGEIDRQYPGMGMFMGLTGARIRGMDVFHCNLATHVGNPGMEHSVAILLSESESSTNVEKIHEMINGLAVVPDLQQAPPSFWRDLPMFEKCFTNKNSVEEIMDALSKYGTPTAKHALEAMKQQPPTALKVAFRLFQDSIDKGLPMETCFHVEFRANQHMMQHPDWKEGIRSTFVDCDNAPRWNPPTLGQVDMDFVESCVSSPLTLAKNGTCDIYYPMDVYDEDAAKREIQSAILGGKLSIVE